MSANTCSNADDHIYTDPAIGIRPYGRDPITGGESRFAIALFWQCAAPVLTGLWVFRRTAPLERCRFGVRRSKISADDNRFRPRGWDGLRVRAFSLRTRHMLPHEDEEDGRGEASYKSKPEYERPIGTGGDVKWLRP